jgi:hypothetical protein
MSADLDPRGRFTAFRLRVIGAPLALALVTGVAAADPRVARIPLAGLMEAVQVNADELPTGPITFAVDDIESAAGQETPIRIALPPPDAHIGDGRPGAFILIRNIPPGVRLNAGMANGRLWVLSLEDVPGLHLVADPGLTGTFTIEFNLIGTNNKRLAQQSVRLSLLSPDAGGKQTTVGTLDTQEAALPKRDAQPPTTSSLAAQRLSPDEETTLLVRGEELLRQGGLVAARILFEELARKGSAKGALDLARSYDPAYMPKSRMSAVVPDANKALEWYRRADELGSTEAKARLAEMASKR